MQAVGRVLRKGIDDKKKFGLILNLYSNRNVLIKNIIGYLRNLDNYSDNKLNHKQINKDIKINNITLNHNKLVEFSQILDFKINQTIAKDAFIVPDNINSDYLISKFVRIVPENKEYQDRVKYEINAILKHNFGNYILQVLHIVNSIKKYSISTQHIIRGSCGSSLVCYLLGITNIDPVVHEIKFTRFISDSRKTMPDIDMDFAYNERDDVFDLIEEIWPNKVGRISNHVYFHEKSAIREAIRLNGFRHRVDNIEKYMNSLDSQERSNINEIKNNLNGTFRTYSLHCGGLVIYPEDIPKEHTLLTKTYNQLKEDKRGVANDGRFKIDILSNRGLAILNSAKIIINPSLKDVSLDIQKMLADGDNIGLTFAESPAMRKQFMKIKPKHIDDIAYCLAVIRPATSEDKVEEALIYDDDAISLIEKKLNCEQDIADRIRRAFCKNDKEQVSNAIQIINSKLNKNDAKTLISKLEKLKRFSFCKSHSISYAQLVLHLADYKIKNPQKYWLYALNHCKSAYRKWVYFQQAKKSGLSITVGKSPWYIENNTLYPSYKENTVKLNSKEQFKKYGYWTDNKFIIDCYYKHNGVNILHELNLEDSKYNEKNVKLKGLIANGRIYDRNKTICTFITIGIFNQLIDIVVPDQKIYYNSFDYCIIDGKFSNNNYKIVTADKIKFYNI